MKTVVIVAYTLRTQTKLINWSLLVLTQIPTDMLTPDPLVIISADLSVYRRIAFRLEHGAWMLISSCFRRPNKNETICVNDISLLLKQDDNR